MLNWTWVTKEEFKRVIGISEKINIESIESVIKL
jgi:hypothetical protein